MDNKSIEKLMQNYEELKNTTNDKQKRQLDIKLLERVLKRLISFSNSCKDCENSLLELESHLERLKYKQGKFEKMDLKEHHRLLNSIIAHLEKDHKLVREGYYMGLYMLFGAGIGTALTYVLFDSDIALGLPMGMALGVAIGAAMDANAKKKDIVI